MSTENTSNESWAQYKNPRTPARIAPGTLNYYDYNNNKAIEEHFKNGLYSNDWAKVIAGFYGGDQNVINILNNALTTLKKDYTTNISEYKRKYGRVPTNEEIQRLTVDHFVKGISDGHWGLMHDLAAPLIFPPSQDPPVQDPPPQDPPVQDPPPQDPPEKTDDPQTGTYMTGDPENTWLRYASPISNAFNYLNSMIKGPDYTNPRRIEDAVNNIRDVDYKPISNYATYKPMDTDYNNNRLMQLSTGTRRAIANANMGNAGATTAALLAQDYNNAGAMGDAYRSSLEYNNSLKDKVNDFNRQTNITNSNMALQAAQANATIDNLRLQGIANAAKMRQSIRDAHEARTDIYQAGLVDDLTSMGMEAYYRNYINSNPDLNNGIGKNGWMYRKNVPIKTTSDYINEGSSIIESQALKDDRKNKQGIYEEFDIKPIVPTKHPINPRNLEAATFATDPEYAYDYNNTIRRNRLLRRNNPYVIDSPPPLHQGTILTSSLNKSPIYDYIYKEDPAVIYTPISSNKSTKYSNIDIPEYTYAYSSNK